MKTYLWILTAAFGLICFVCWVASSLVNQSLQQLDMATLLPVISEVVLKYGLWILFLPLPWILYAGKLSRKRELNPKTVLVFTGTLFLGTTILICVTALACVLPWMAKYNC